MSTYNGPLEPCGENGFGIVIQLGAVECIWKGKNGGCCRRGVFEKSLDYIYGLSNKSVMYDCT